MHAFLPYTRLFLHDLHAVALSANGHIQVLDSSTGSAVQSTNRNTELAAKLQKSGELIAAAVDESFKYLVTATNNKSITVWKISGLNIVFEREAPKKPTNVCFTRDAQTVLVSDKFGDVHRYPIRPSFTATNEQGIPASSDVKGSKKHLTDESLLLGHVSLLTTLLLSEDEKYIITADRDEHIRVSWYPEAYTIESYCLGHRKFVSALHIPPWDTSLLLSGGGDPELRLWNWMEGKLLREVPIRDAVMPFIKVVRKKQGREQDGSDGEEEGPRTSSREKWRNKKKRKDKEGAEPGTEQVNENDDKEDEMQADKPQAKQMTESGLNTLAEFGEPETVNELPSLDAAPLLAVQKIEALEFGPNRFVVFSAHGATALFYYTFRDPSCPPPEVRSVALDHPVLDFARWPGGDEIWVTVDGNWSESETATAIPKDPKFIKVIKVVGDELAVCGDSSHQSLVQSLNTTSRFEAPQESFKNIDLYSALAVLPKNLDVEHNAMDIETQLSEASAKARQLSGKELGRLQTKKAVLALQATERNNKREHSNTGTSSEDRTLKRQKSESEATAQ